MTEFIIVALLFALPLFLMIPLVAKYIDMKGTAIQGARYVAWERTVFFGDAAASVDWPGVAKSNEEIHNEVRQRIFTDGRAIAESDKSASANTSSGFKNSWHNRNGSAMLPSYDRVAQTLQQRPAPGVANDLLNLSVRASNAVGNFRIETQGLFQATVSVSADTQKINMSLNQDSSKDFAPGTLRFSDSNTLLANGWSANGSEHVKQQTQGLTPSSVFANPTVSAIFSAIKNIAQIAAPEIRSLDIGKIEPDVVPPDRLISE
ncbi:MAG: hypothetical protein V4623_04425 [Pseudomonadota bacterium]